MSFTPNPEAHGRTPTDGPVCGTVRAADAALHGAGGGGAAAWEGAGNVDGAAARGLIDTLPVAIYMTDADGCVTYYNAAAAEVWGRGGGVGQARWCGSVRACDVSGRVLDAGMHPTAVALREGRPVRGVEMVLERPDGAWRPVMAQVDVLRDSAGKVAGTRTVLVDMTEAARAREMMKLSESRCRVILETQPECVKVVAADGTLIDMNPAGLMMIEAESLEAVRGQSVLPLIEPEWRETYREMHARALAGERAMAEFGIVGMRGTKRWMESRAIPIEDAGGVVSGVLSITRDITEARDNGLAVQRLAAIVESSEDIIIGKNLQGIVTSWNAGAERILGYTAAEMVGQSILKLVPDSRKAEEDLILGRIRSGGRVDHFETERVTKDGKLIQLSLTVSPIRDRTGKVVGASKIARDISERIAAERKLAKHAESLARAVSHTRQELERSQGTLRRSERLVALGTMAGGLGHDIGNLLLPMRSSIDVLRAQYSGDPVAEEACTSLARCADYFASLVRGLRLFGRGEADDAAGESVTLEEWVEDAMPLLGNLAGRGIRVHADIAPGLQPVAVGPGSLTQVVVNLVKNGVDALHTVEGGTGEIEIRAYEEGEGVRLDISDNGPGMTAQVLGQCMEPYFTTRVRGQQSGTGLGLSLVHSVVTEAGGRVEIVSEPGKGTRVQLWLPRKVEKVKAAVAAVAEVRVGNAATAALLVSLLRSGGYAPRAAAELDPGAALWVTDSLTDEEAGKRSRHKPVVLLGDVVVGGGLDAAVCRVSARPTATEFVRCLESLRRPEVG